MTDRQSTHTEDAIAKQEHVAELDAIVRESDAQVPVAATLDDAAADPALTLDVARELLRDAAAGIRSLAASATPRTEPAEGREACPRDCGCVVHCRRPTMSEMKWATRAKTYGRRGGQKATGAQKLCIEGELINLQEIACRLGVSPSAARKRYKRALASGAQRITWEALGLE